MKGIKPKEKAEKFFEIKPLSILLQGRLFILA